MLICYTFIMDGEPRGIPEEIRNNLTPEPSFEDNLNNARHYVAEVRDRKDNWISARKQKQYLEGFKTHVPTLNQALTNPHRYLEALETIHMFEKNRAAIKESTEVAWGIIIQNYDQLRSLIEANDGQGANILMQLARHKIKTYDDKTKKHIFDADALRVMLDNFQDGFLESQDEKDYGFYITNMISDDMTSDQLQQVLDLVLKITSSSDPKFYMLKPTVIKEFLGSGGYDEHESLGVSMIEHRPLPSRIKMIVDHYGLDFDVLINAWVRASGIDSINSSNIYNVILSSESLIYKSVERIIKLESIYPGASKFLLEQFGIKSFGRYPLELLIHQYSHRYDKEKPYGVLLYPRDDWNGAFSTDGEVLENLLTRIRSLDFNLRIYECEDKVDLVSALNDARHKFGKISFAVIGGHGSKDSIQFGDKNDSDHNLYKEDLLKKGAPAVTHAFVENPSIILQSCSTGIQNGIGQQMSSMGAKVYAPDRPTFVSDIDPYMDKSGNLTFKVKYEKRTHLKIYDQGIAA